MLTEVYDLETIINLFTYTGYCLQTKQYYQFVIHDSVNQLEELVEHLKRPQLVQVGFNNENFDYPLIHHILSNYERLQYATGSEIAAELYERAQQLIRGEEYNVVPDRKKYIQQIDLFLIWHYNNAARRTSLKDLEFAMNMPNIEEMPIAHNQYCTSKEIPLVLNYNKNDVEATVLFLEATLGQTDYSLYKKKNKLALRFQLAKKFNIPCNNYPDVKIGEQLMLQLYSRATEKNPWDVKKLRTPRESVDLKDCIPPWCQIRSKEFNRFLEIIKNTKVRGDKKEFAHSIIFHGISFDFGLGGSHGCIAPGVYKSDESGVILDLDVSSLYPSVAKSLNAFPAHLGIEFMQLYSQFIEARLAEKKKPKGERDEVLIEGYKLILNGTYGKSGEDTSFLFDKLYTYKTTIAGQLFICMWAERMVEVCPELQFIQINTDGITIKLPKEKIPLIMEVCNQLTKETTLEVEDAYYSQMIIRDVNNYMAQYSDDVEHIKYKGCFEIDKEYHKDNSMRIVPIALKNYFIYNTPISETIRNHKNIYDFCIRLKCNHSSKALYSYLDEDDRVKDLTLSRTTRYFISKKGGALSIYYNGSDSPNKVNKGYTVTLFNNFIEQEDYNINYNFYEIETNKIIDIVVNNQLNLF